MTQRLLALLGLLITLAENGPDPGEATIIPLVITLIVFEAVLCGVKGWPYYKRSDTWCSLGLLAGNVIVNAAVKGGSLIFSQMSQMPKRLVINGNIKRAR